MRRKNVFEFCILGLFIMCIGLALSAALEYVTVGSEREYLGQGKWLLSLLCIAIASFFAVRLGHKAGSNLGKNLKNAMAFGACALFFLAGLWLRLWVIANIPVEPDSDFETYYRMATELYNDTMLTPAAALDRRYAAMYPHTIGFPMLILLPAFRLAGPSVETALYANLVCSMLSVLLAGHIGKKVAGKIGAVLAVALMSLWPSHILYSNMVATEQSFTMMILLAADIMVHVMDRGRGSLYETGPARATLLLLFLGVVLALSGAIRPMAIVLLAAWAVVQMFIGGDPKGEVPQSGSRWILARGWMCVLLVAIPYLLVGSVINKTITDTIMIEPASGLTASGYNLMVGVNTASGGRWNDEDARFFGNVFDETGDANLAHQACMQKAIERVTQAPEDVLNLLVYKFRDLWQTDDFGIDWNLQWTDMQGTLTPELKSLLEAIRPTGRVMYMAVLLFALIGAIEAWRRHNAPPPMLMVNVLFFLGTALAHMLLETQVRYHYNMIPFLILLGVQAVACWRERVAEEPAVKLIPAADMGMEEAMTDHTHFDMHTALREGHVHMSVSEAVAERSAQHSLVSVAVAEEDEDEPVKEAVEETAVEAENEAVTEETTEKTEETVIEDVAAEEGIEEASEESATEDTEPAAEDAVEEIAEEIAEETAPEADTEETSEESATEDTELVDEEATEEVAEEIAEVVAEEVAPEAETENPSEESATEDTEPAAEEAVVEVAEEIAEVVAEATPEADTEETSEESATEDTELVDEEATEEVAEEIAEVVAEEAAPEAETENPSEESATEDTEPVAEEAVEEVAEEIAEVVAEATPEADTEETSEESVTEDTEPVAEEAVEEVAEEIAEVVAEATPEADTEETSEETATEDTEPVAEKVAEAVTAAVVIKAKAAAGSLVDADVIPAPVVRTTMQNKAVPAAEKASAVASTKSSKPAVKKAAQSTALKTPRAPAKRQKLEQQERVQRMVDRRKAVARRKQQRQRLAARKG